MNRLTHTLVALAALMVKAFFGLAGTDGVSGNNAARRAGDAERDAGRRRQ